MPKSSLLQRNLLLTLWVLFLGGGVALGIHHWTERLNTLVSLNGQTIQRRDYQQHLEQLQLLYRQNPQLKNKQTQLTTLALQQLVERHLYLQEAQRRNLLIGVADIDEEWQKLQSLHYQGNRERMLDDLQRQRYSEKGFRQELQQRLLMKKTQETLLTEYQIPKKVLEEHYQGHLQDYHSPEKIEVRHILFKGRIDEATRRNQAKIKAEKLLKEIQSGLSFETAAKKYSEDETSRDQGGLLPAFAKGEMSAEFENVVWPMTNNSISVQPIASEYGYHLVRKEKTIPSHTKSFQEARPIFEARLKEKHQQHFLTQWLEEQKRLSQIYYHPDYAPQQKP